MGCILLETPIALQMSRCGILSWEFLEAVIKLEAHFDFVVRGTKVRTWSCRNQVILSSSLQKAVAPNVVVSGSNVAMHAITCVTLNRGIEQQSAASPASEVVWIASTVVQSVVMNLVRHAKFLSKMYF